MKIASEIDTLYTIGVHTCGHEHHQEPFQAILPENWTKLIDQIAKDLHSGNLKPEDLSRGLIEKTYHQLDTAAGSGYGKLWIKYDPAKKNGSIKPLKASLWRFSGVKAYQELLVMRDKMVKNGKILSFPEFRNEVLKVHEDYDIAYLQAEYQTAKQSASSARKWQSIQKNKDLFPNLEYRTVGDSRVREEHAVLDSIIKPVDDSFWDTHYPPNDWRCRCYVKQVKGNVSTEVPKVAIRPAFKNNSGRSNKIFSDEHPYFKIPKSEVNKMKIAFEQTKEFAPYHETFKSGKFILRINEFAHDVDLVPNIKSGKLIVEKLKRNVDIRPHIEITQKKNPEYTINGLLSDRKEIRGKGPKNVIHESITQNLQVVVLDINKYTGTLERLLQQIKGEMKGRESRIEEFIIIKNDDVKAYKLAEIMK